MGIEDPEADVAEQHIPAVPDDEDVAEDEDEEDLPFEADPADVAEQHVPGRPAVGTAAEVPFEADPADVAEQLRTVPVETADELLD
jgi:hypothetical protein